MGSDRSAVARRAREAQRRQARIDDRAALTGILFVLKSGIPWEMLPQEMSCGSGMNCWRRLKEWNEAGVWKRLHQKLLERLGEADQIEWERASLDSASVPAPGGRKSGPNPTDKGKQGSKRHVVVDREGIPLSVIHSAATIHDSKVLEEAVDAICAIRKPSRGRPRKRPKKLHTDKAYDFPRCREALRKRSITPLVTEQTSEHGRGTRRIALLGSISILPTATTSARSRATPCMVLKAY